jgi:tetratricopeptide (TPR) repeat protein
LLDYLVGFGTEEGRGPKLDVASQALLFVFAGRIQLYDTHSTERAFECFSRAQLRGVNDGRVHSGFGEYYREMGRGEDALGRFQDAISTSRDLPDGYVGLGLYFEAEKRWEEADAWFEKAAQRVRDDRDPLVALLRLRAPSSGRLCLQLARALQTDMPQAALNAVEHALSLGIEGPGKYPEVLAYELKGELLSKVGERSIAAEAFFQGALRRSWSGETAGAITLLRRARTEDEWHLPSYWRLADSLLTQSYSEESPYVVEEPLDEALKLWQEGIRLGRPSDADGWAYLTRALIDEQYARLAWNDRWALIWQGIAWIEQSLLKLPTHVYAWVSLCRLHRTLANDRNALHAANRALELGPNDLHAIEERIVLFANLSRADETRGAIEQWRKLKQESDPWAEAVLAHVDCVVSTRGTIRDDAARSFAIGFYGGLGERESVAAAYQQGCAAIRLEGLPDADPAAQDRA